MAESIRELLNPAQLNSLVIALSMFEENLCQAATWLDDTPPEGIVHRYTLRLPVEQVAAARAEIAAALDAIAVLARDLDTTPVEGPIEARIAAAMSVSWANLCDVKSARMVRYGPVDDALGDVLDARIDTLAQQALRLATLFGSES